MRRNKRLSMQEGPQGPSVVAVFAAINLFGLRRSLAARSRASSLRFGFHASVALGASHNDAAFALGYRKRLTTGGALKEGFGFAVLPHLLCRAGLALQVVCLGVS